MRNPGCRPPCREQRRSKPCSGPGFSSETTSSAAWHEAGLSGELGAVSCDLRQEGLNMLRLAEAHQQAQNPLSASSRQARTVLGQF
ncbi:hypothetical protein E4633_11455 [Geomonas terrae]|uniref:Uncharacterized protein n=1 Tax=Geomonas terrae TaxID=2562681 RepID=A0A4S1CC11_9BACT|nr:hypothetical protein [Geomonas terrae]TGU70476.1 hypothetical protein E4633_15845 [Geomonas terrae]TGU72896.1 hypothetical protein E4633_11455 [Geomonas terrae]